MRDVLIVGVSTRPAADSAARAGYAVTALDAFGDLDQSRGVRALSMSRDCDTAFTASSAARVAERLDADAVMYLSNFENHPKAVQALARSRVLLGNPPAVLKRVRDPWLLAAALERRGMPHPLLSSRAKPPKAAKSRDDNWLLKPRRSGGGRRILDWTPVTPIPRGSYLQERIDGVPGSISFVAAGGRAVPLGLTIQIVGDAAFGAEGFEYCGNILTTGAPLFTHATRLSNIVTEEFGLVGVNGIDFVARGGMPYPVEVNPRYSASMELVERTYGVSVFAAHAAACTVGELSSFDLERASRDAPATGKATVFARHDVVCGDTRAWLDDPTVRDIPHPGEPIRAGHPVCTVFADGVDASACYDALVRRANAMYTELRSWAMATA